MKLILSVVFLSFLMQTCKDSPKVIPKKTITKLDFTYVFPVKAIYYSLKLTTGDTVYVKDYVSSQADTSFYAILTEQDRLKVDRLINNVALSAVDTSYIFDVIDGDEYNLSISKNDTLKSIYVHGGNIPEELRRLTDYLMELKTKLKLLSIHKTN